MTIDVRAMSFKLLAKFGKQSELVRASDESEYNPETGDRTTPTDRYPIKIYIQAPSRQDMAQALVNGQAIATGQSCILSALGLPFDPAPTDSIAVDGTDRIITEVVPIWSGEQVALWRCIIRS